MKKNAGIKTKEEAMKRMIDGEVFYLNRNKYFFDPTHLPEGRSPFRTDLPVNRGTISIENSWEHISQWEIEVDWRDTLEEAPRLCWVWDFESIKRESVVVDYIADITYPYITTSSEWTYAELMTKEEIQVFLDRCE